MSSALRLATAAGLVGLAIIAIVTVSAPAATPARVAAPARCFAVTVVGRTVQAATAVLRARRCTPGFARNGRHYLVTKACRPLSDFGKVFEQSARNRLLGPKERLILRVGIRRTTDGRICGEISPDPGPPPSAADYNGSYEATFTVTESSTPLAKVGQQLNGLRFTVQNGNISGDITGTVDASGESKDATANIAGLSCQAPLAFTLGGGGTVTLAGSVACTGAATVKGTLAGQRTGP